MTKVCIYTIAIKSGWMVKCGERERERERQREREREREREGERMTTGASKLH